MHITDIFPAVPDAPADCGIITFTYYQSSGMLLFINSIWDAVKVSKLPNITPGSLVPRLSCVGGEKRAWYTLFAHAQFSQDFWEFGNFL